MKGKRRIRVAVYDAWLNTLGGGEKAGSIPRSLRGANSNFDGTDSGPWR